MAHRKRQQGGRELETCVYCSDVVATTRDHVISKALYVPPYPDNLLTMPACRGCNERKSLSEDSFRDFLSMDLVSAPAPDARSLFHSSVTRSVMHNRSKVARELLQHGRRIPIFTPGGLFAGYAFGVELPDTPVTTTLDFVICGLFFAKCGRRLEQSVEIEIRRSMTTPEEFARLWEIATGAGYPYFTQGTAFRCLYATLPPEPTCSIWAVQFYERTTFMVETKPAAVATGTIRPPQAPV